MADALADLEIRHKGLTRDVAALVATMKDIMDVVSHIPPMSPEGEEARQMLRRQMSTVYEEIDGLRLVAKSCVEQYRAKQQDNDHG